MITYEVQFEAASKDRKSRRQPGTAPVAARPIVNMKTSSSKVPGTAKQDERNPFLIATVDDTTSIIEDELRGSSLTQGAQILDGSRYTQGKEDDDFAFMNTVTESQLSNTQLLMGMGGANPPAEGFTSTHTDPNNTPNELPENFPRGDLRNEKAKVAQANQLTKEGQEDIRLTETFNSMSFSQGPQIFSAMRLFIREHTYSFALQFQDLTRKAHVSDLDIALWGIFQVYASSGTRHQFCRQLSTEIR